MASKFVCVCGYTVRTNMFEGHGIYRLVSDNEIDKVDDTQPAKAVIDLWLRSKECIKCKGCGCLYLWNQEVMEYVRYTKA